MSTARVELLVIARLDGPDGAAADLYSGELLADDRGHTDAYTRGPWWESLPVAEQDHPTDMAAIDCTLRTHGYTRTCDWHAHTTASGVIRYFATATMEIEDL
ncbi:hypothetical protein ACFQZZ_33240 [Nocardia sp. GCM10030253]|uniref:hypothetical protein n=1 Tax=Nocardia sp. GCM10030253 TaxID=3273404 RepID=UPI0036403C6B